MSITFRGSPERHKSKEDQTVKTRSHHGRVFTVLGATIVAILISFAVIQATNTPVSTNAPGSGVITTSPLVGTQAPSFRLPTLENNAVSVSLADLLGKPVVVNFFSPACVPCREEMPTFAALGKLYQGKINFIGVDETSSVGSALSFIRADHVAYPVVIDANGDLIGPYLVPGVPVTVFISASGTIKGYVAGAISKATLRVRTSQLL